MGPKTMVGSALGTSCAPLPFPWYFHLSALDVRPQYICFTGRPVRIASVVVLSTNKSDATGNYADKNQTCATLHHSGRAMTTALTGSGNQGGRPRGSRNRAILNEEFIAALLRHFRRDGERAIARMAATQPAAYCKILTLLVPREHKLEHANAITSLSDEQLEAMIEHIKSSLERRAAGDKAKVIEGTETLGGERPGSPRSRR